MAHDAAVKEKAKEMFVINGFSMNTIETMLPEVSKKTLYNWKEKDGWEEQRKSRVKSVTGRREQLESAIDEALLEWRATKDAKLLFAIGKAVSALKQMNTFEFTDEKKSKSENRKKGLSPEVLAEIENKILEM